MFLLLAAGCCSPAAFAASGRTTHLDDPLEIVAKSFGPSLASLMEDLKRQCPQVSLDQPTKVFMSQAFPIESNCDLLLKRLLAELDLPADLTAAQMQAFEQFPNAAEFDSLSKVPFRFHGAPTITNHLNALGIYFVVDFFRFYEQESRLPSMQQGRRGLTRLKTGLIFNGINAYLQKNTHRLIPTLQIRSEIKREEPRPDPNAIDLDDLSLSDRTRHDLQDLGISGHVSKDVLTTRGLTLESLTEIGLALWAREDSDKRVRTICEEALALIRKSTDGD